MKTADALSLTQRRDLRRLLGDDALVERVAKEVAIFKSGRLLVGSLTDAQCLKHLRDLHKALEKALALIAIPEVENYGVLGLDGRIRHRITGGCSFTEWGLRDTKWALSILKGAVSDILEDNAGNKGGRPRDSWPDFMYAGIGEIAHGKPSETFSKVLEIALAAGGCDAEEITRIIGRRQRATTRARRTNPPKK